MIKIENLYYKYPSAKENTIKGLNFEIKKGEIFGFLGPSGAGKSTTQKIIIGVLKDYNGSVNVMDSEVSKMKNEYYESIGVAFEFPNLYTKFTAMENLNFFNSLYKNKHKNPIELLEMVGLENDANLRVDNFSKGMKMRLNFARCLLNDPQIIFLDEPTSGLDPVNARKVRNIILQKKKEGKTIFLTTHNMHTADELCDRVAFITDGQINLIGKPRELKIQNGKKQIIIEYHKENKVLSKKFDMANIGENIEFLSFIKQNEIETIHSQETSLEDIFIETTGRGLS